jgi:predicted dehydrogenase
MYDADNFDYAGLDFIGGGNIRSRVGRHQSPRWSMHYRLLEDGHAGQYRSLLELVLLELESPDKWGRLSANVAGLHVDGPLESQPGGYQLFYAALCDALHSGGPPPVDPADAIGVLRVIEAARVSARTARVREVE